MKNPLVVEEELRQKERQRLHITERRQLHEDIRRTFGNAPGLRTLNWIFGILGKGRSVFTGSSETFYLSGRLDAAQVIENRILEADPTIIVALLQERHSAAHKKLDEMEAKAKTDNP